MNRRDLLGAFGAAAALSGSALGAGRRRFRGRATSACGEASVTTREEGSLDSGEGEVYTYGFRTTGTCRVEVSLVAEGDFDLYLTTDGREPTTSDYDHRSRTPGEEESIVLEDGALSDGEVRVLVYAYAGSGAYTLSIAERGEAVESAPTAAFSVDPSAVSPGDPVRVDATAASDPEGSIASYEWAFGDGFSGSGEAAEHAYDDAGEYTITLTVTDGDGATATARTAVTVTGASTAATTETATFSGKLTGVADQGRHTYTPQTDVPRRITVELDGANGRDFDLYLTTDGRAPAVDDFDRRAWTDGGGESLVLTGVDAGTELGVLVDAWRGTGSYEVTITEESAAVSGTCGSAKATATDTGTLSGTGDQARFSYAAQTASPCRVVATLTADGDADLYATTDGRTPTREDHDAAARSVGGRERLAVSEWTDLVFTVDAYRDGGSYELQVDEFGG